MKRVLAVVCLLYIGTQVLDTAGYCLDGDDEATCVACATMHNIRASEPDGVRHESCTSTQPSLAGQDEPTGRLLPSDFYHPPRTLA